MSEDLFSVVEPRTWSFLVWSLKKNAENAMHGFWTDGEDILCNTEQEADNLANFLEDLGFDIVHTGYYNPDDDEKSGEVDDHTGYWYVSID